jgi:dihydroorotate dehydrogenase
MILYSLIGLIYQRLLKPVFFLQDPELVHDRMSVLGTFLGKFAFIRAITKLVFRYDNEKYLGQTVAGMYFANPVGLSAGFDKNAKLLNILPSVGFGYMEVGSITHKPYEGNPKPRLYRLPKSQALVVYYGLKNDGVVALIPKLKAKRDENFKLFISVAKTNCKETSKTEEGANDYADCLRVLEREGVGDAYTINISCPNTFGGEPFTTPERLELLMKKISKLKIQKPVFVKMPINLGWNEFDALLKVILKYGLTGVVIGNLNKNHNDPSIKDSIPGNIKGGISGKPTFELSNALISKTYKKYGDKFVIIGVGGIFSAEDAYEKIKRGASIVQLITGLIYKGPSVVGEINFGLMRLLREDGYKNVGEAVGVNERRLGEV